MDSSVSVEQAYDYCREVTRHTARNFYYAFLALPLEKRKSIYATYAFCHQCDDYGDEKRPLQDKARLLKEYRQELAQAYDATPRGPVFTALWDTAQKYDIPREYFDDVITGVEMDLEIFSYQTFDDLRQYCYRVASVVGLICIEIFGYDDFSAREHAVDLGIAMQLTNILRDLKEDSNRSRTYLPQEDLDAFGYSKEELKEGVLNESYTNLMGFQVERAREYFDRGKRLLPLLTFRSRLCAAVLRGIYSELLNRIEARDYDVFKVRIGLTTSEKVTLTGRIWLQTLLEDVLALR